MNVIFLTMANLDGIATHGIYQDLMRKFRDEGHHVYIASPLERRLVQCSKKLKVLGSELLEVDGVKILKVRTLNLQKTNVVEKGIGQLLVESQFKRAIKKYLSDVTFDLILYSTPPITFPKVIEYLKRTNPTAKSYLLLKDIFPQNAVDLGMMPGASSFPASTLKAAKPSVKFQVSSVKSWVSFGKYQLYKMFRRKEKRLYALSDYIGCMSPANVRYVIEHNPEVDPKKVEVAPNSIEAPCPPKGENFENETDKVLRENNERYQIRKKYNLPLDKPVFIYGGNLGKPQGIPFLVECLEANAHRDDCHFVVVGNGTEFHYLESRIAQMKEIAQMEQKPFNVHLMKSLPKEDYDQLARACDVGLIFLDYRFTIPNYPSRLLPYLMEKKPIIAATDPNSDIGCIAEENGYGYWCPSNSVEAFTAAVDKMLQSDCQAMGEAGYKFLLNNYTVTHTYQTIVKHLEES